MMANAYAFNFVTDLGPVVNQHIHHFSQYNFLWKDDMHAIFKEFMSFDPGVLTIENEVGSTTLYYTDI